MGVENGDASGELLDQVAQVLVAESAVGMTTDRGGTVELWTIVADGPCVAASAPRLQVAEQMRLTCRLSVDGFTYRVSAVIDRAVVHCQTRAKLMLRVLDALADPVVRRSDRLDVSVRATMVALVCDRIVPDEAFTVAIEDVSSGGFQASVPDRRVCPGDRLRLVGRFLEGPVDCEVCVKWTADTPREDGQRVGCAFIEPSPTVQATVHRLLHRFTAPERPQTESATRLAQTFYPPSASEHHAHPRHHPLKPRPFPSA